MNESINYYKTRKLIYEIMFNFEKFDYTENPNIFSLMIIKSFRNIIEYHVESGDLIKPVIDNINKFLSQARYYEDQDREERINIINEIITMMNNSKTDNSLMFYRLQLYDRTKEFKYLFKCSNNEIINEIDHVHDSICNDLYVVASHSDDFTDEEFIKETLPYFKDSSLYYESLNMILKENPLVFKDLTFYNRMICVLNMNNEIYKDDEEMLKYNDKLVKKINKRVKKIKQK